MKRSEMIENIRSILRRELRNEGVQEPKLSNVLMEAPINILNNIEKSGMLPPRTLLIPMNIEDNAWDPEDSSL